MRTGFPTLRSWRVFLGVFPPFASRRSPEQSTHSRFLCFLWIDDNGDCEGKKLSICGSPWYRDPPRT